MTDVQTPKRISRNAPCPCGSGKKYKRCHLLMHEKIAAMNTKATEKLHNDEPGRQPQATETAEVMMLRDQKVFAWQLTAHKRALARDRAHLKHQLLDLKGMIAALESLPACEGRTALMASTKKEIKQIEETLLRHEFPRASKVTLDALNYKLDDLGLRPKTIKLPPVDQVKAGGPHNEGGKIQTEVSEEDDIRTDEDDNNDEDSDNEAEHIED